MPVGPRSQRLLSFHSQAADWSPLFVCPDGAVTLLKNANVWNVGVAPVGAFISVNTASGTSVVVLFATIELNTPVAWEGWVALHPGDSVGVYAGAAGVSFYISGAVLPGDPLYAPGELATPRAYPPQVGTTPTAGTSPSPVLPTVQRTVRAGRRR